MSTAGGTGAIRVGDAERDQVTSALHEHFAQGRLTRDELDERLEATLSARTVGDLRAITRDLPVTTEAMAALSPVTMGAIGEEAGPHGPWYGSPLWGPRRFRPRHGHGHGHGHGFMGVAGRLLVVAFVITAFAGGWAILPFFVVAWVALAFFGIRHVRRWHHPGTVAGDRYGR